MDKYRVLLDDKEFSGIIVVLDNKSNIIDANNEFLDLLGFTFEEIDSKHISDLIVPDEKSLFFDIVFTQDISNLMTLKFYHKSGAFRFFSFSIFNFETYKLLVGNTLKKDFLAKKFEYVSHQQNSISEIFKNIEVDDIRELLTFEDNPLSLILDIMPIEVWVKDKIGKYVYVNETYTKATGVKLQDCLLKDDFQLFSSDTAKAFVEADELAIKSGKKISFSFETIDKSIASFAEVTKIPIYNNSNKYIGLLGFSINTSYSKTTEIELEKEKVRLKFIIDNIKEFVFEINPSGELLYVSENLRNLLGLDLDNTKIMDSFFNSNKTLEAREKLKLALNGEKVHIDSVIMGTAVSFSLNPVKNSDNSYNIIGFGNVVVNGGDKDGK